MIGLTLLGKRAPERSRSRLASSALATRLQDADYVAALIDPAWNRPATRWEMHWEHHVPDSVRTAWHLLDLAARAAVRETAQEAALLASAAEENAQGEDI